MTGAEFVFHLIDLANDVIENKLDLESAYQKGLMLFPNDKELTLQYLFLLNESILKSGIIDFPSASVLANLSYRFAQTGNDEELLGRCTVTYAKLAVKNNQHELALELLSQARTIFSKLNRTDGLLTVSDTLGDLYKTVGKLKEAEQEFLLALKIARNTKSISSEIATLNNLALLFQQFKNTSKAKAYYTRALNLAIRHKKTSSKLKILINLAGLYRESRQFEKAIDYLAQVVDIERSLDDKHEIANFTMKLGNLYMEWEHLDEAVKCFREAHLLAENINNADIQILCLGCLGLTYCRLANWEEAGAAFNNALQLARRLHKVEYEIMIMNNTGYLYFDRGNPAKALQHHQMAYHLAKKAGKIQDQVVCLVDMGQAEVSIGKAEAALAHIIEASELMETDPDDELFIRMLNVFALAYLDLGKIAKAQEFFKDALRYAREMGAPRILGPILLNYGLACYVGHDITAMLKLFEEGIEIARDIKDREIEGTIYLSLGDLYSIYGDLEQAKKEYLKALELYRRIGFRSGILITLLNFTRIAVRQDLIDEAEAYYLKMIRLARRWQHSKYEMEAIGSLGILLYRSRNKPKDSINYLRQAIRIARQLGSPSEESRWKYHIGNLMSSVEKHEKAQRIYEIELAAAKESGNIDLERALSVKLAQTCYHQYRYKEAYPSLKRAVLLTERLRAGNLQEQHRISFLQERIDIYELAVNVCLALGKNAEALEYIEKGKSRALMDLVATLPLFPQEQSEKTNDLIRRETALLQQLRSIQNIDLFDLTSESLKIRNKPASRYHALVEELDEIYTALEKFESQYVSLRRGTAPDLNAISEALLS